MNGPSASRAGLLLLGGGGHAAVVAEAARLAGWRVAGCLDDAESSDVSALRCGIQRLGPVTQLTDVIGALDQSVVLHAAVGDPVLRRRWLDGGAAPVAAAIIHPTAVVSPHAHLAPGVFVGPLAVINPGADIGTGVIVNSGAIIEHDCRVGDYAHIAPRSVLTGSVIVGAEALIGAGAVVLPGRSIGTGAVVGAGSVVVRNVASGHTVAGIPAAASRV